MAYVIPDPGQMRAIVTIHAPEITGRDADGYPIRRDAAYSTTVYAKWTDNIGTDADDRAEARHRRAATVEIRYLAGVTPECTLTRCGDPLPWKIISVAEVAGWKSWLRISVIQEVSR